MTFLVTGVRQKSKLVSQLAQERKKMALREGNEADAVLTDQERLVPAPRPRKMIMNMQPLIWKDNENITEWLINWDIEAVVNGWTEENQVQLIPTYLSGRASRMFWRISLEDKQDLQQLQESLYELFNSEGRNF